MSVLLALALAAGQVTPPPVTLAPAVTGTDYLGRTCTWWSNGKNERIVRAAQLVMLGGFLTGYNQWNPGPTGDLPGSFDLKLAESWLDAYCQAHDTTALVDGMVALVEHLRSRPD